MYRENGVGLIGEQINRIYKVERKVMNGMDGWRKKSID